MNYAFIAALCIMGAFCLAAIAIFCHFALSVPWADLLPW
jgi:hypothetical protein